MRTTPIKLHIFSQAHSVPGQGVGAAYTEQVQLIRQSKKLSILKSHYHQADILHFHTINFRYWLRMLLTKKIKVVYVHFIPSTLSTSLKLPRLFFRILKWYVKKFYQTASYLVVVNPVFIEPLMAMGIAKERIHFIPNYVDEATFTSHETIASLRARFQFTRFTILGVGQVQHRKGILDFIEVAKRLPHLDFVWAGGFSFKRMTAGYEALKLIMDNPPPNVKFLGIIPREKMKDVYKACDVFFLPSLDELMPMSVLEAAVCAKPIVLRDLPLYQPVFFGHYLSAPSTDGFVKIIEQLASNEETYATSLSHSKWLKEAYRKEAILKQWEDYYQEVIDHHGKTH